MLTMEMVLHKDVDFAPKFGKNFYIYYFPYIPTLINLFCLLSVY